jgi:L-alanine-DL-glutamate epimerase-like enolase superfamily enzyme
MTRRELLAMPAAALSPAPPVNRIEVFPAPDGVNAYFRFLPKPFALSGGALEVPRGPGLGVEVDEERVRKGKA